MHAVVTAGGTGGHIFPALEIAKELKNNNVKTTFVGNSNSLEEKITSQNNINFFAIYSLSFVGKPFLGKIKTIIYLKLAIIKCLLFIIKNKVSFVIGVGGYVSFPMVIAAFLLRKPCYICEQNVSPGLANKVLSFISKKIFITFKESKKYFSNKNIIYTGNPVRKEFFNINKNFENIENNLSILVTGGSLGAKIFNEDIPKAIDLVQKNNKNININITHQTGKNNYHKTTELYEKYNIKNNLIEFITDMPKEFEKHDIIISRAGATICCEICAAGMPAILVPYRFANAHQKDNALALQNNNAAIMLEENNDFATALALIITNIYKEPNVLEKMSLNAKNLAMPNAQQKIIKEVLS